VTTTSSQHGERCLDAFGEKKWLIAVWSGRRRQSDDTPADKPEHLLVWFDRRLAGTGIVEERHMDADGLTTACIGHKPDHGRP
jgi:hypothetical protein